MPALTTFDQLAQYALRKNSQGVNQINITELQLSDRVEEALAYWAEYSADARHKTYATHKLTGSHLQLTTNLAANFPPNTLVQGNTSSATMVVYDAPELNKIRTRTFDGTFVVGETITAMNGVNQGQTAVIATNGIFVGDIQNGYITLASEIISVMRIIPATSNFTGSGAYIFDTQFQISLKMLSNYSNAYLFDYYLLQENLSLIDMLFGKTSESIPFSRILGKLNFDAYNYEIDAYIVMQVYSSLNSANNSAIYDNFFVKKYAYALVKKQWAENLGKYQNVILPGGIQVNADRLWDQAVAEIEKLEELMMTTYMEPLGFRIG